MPSTSPSTDYVVKVSGLRKKFCRDLKRSMIYGLRDIVASSLGSDAYHKTLRRDEFWAVDGVDFELKPGECLGLIGHNGAGKTTLLKMLNGLIKPDYGRIEMRGRVGALIALGAGFNPILTGRENVYINGSILGMTKREIDRKFEEIVDFAEVRHAIDAPVQTYSSGMAVRLGFAVAAKCDPDILLLDEVLAVGDVGFQAKCFNTLAAYRENGTAFILVAHNMHHILRYCDRILYLKGGRVHYLGNTRDGVDQYVKDMGTPSSESSDETTDWTQVYGTGKVVIKAAKFLDKNGNEIVTATPNEPVTLSVSYACPQGPTANLSLDVVVRDKVGTLFQGTNYDFDCDFGTLGEFGEINVTFPDFPANDTEVNFFLTLINKKTAEVFDWKRFIKLGINSNTHLTGRISLRPTWNMVPAKQIEAKNESDH